MEQVSYTLRLDLKDTGIVNTGFRLKQGDSGMKISVSIFNRGVNVFDSTTVPKIVFKRPDGASVMANMTVGSSVYEYVFVGNELQQPGVEIMDVKFTLPNDRRESSVSCSFVVVPDTITPNTHGQDIYDNDLAELVAEATAAAETVEEVVGDSEAWAVGERNGVPVGPEDPAYHNNSKWWSEQANVTSLAALTDVDLNTPSNGDLLQFDSTSGKWKNSADVWDTMAQNGAHNLAVCKIDSGVENGLTWIEQDDGSAIATASSMSGNANITTTEFSLKKGRYILSKNPHIGNSRIALLVNGSVYDNVITYDDEIEFTLANDSSACKIRFYCTAPTGGVVESTKIQPMIRLAIDKDTTYQQGAKTNRELTEYATTKKGSLSPSQYTTSAENVRVRQVGNSVHIWGFCNNNIQHSDGSNNNVLGTITGVTLPKTDEAVRTVCGIAAHAYDVPQQVGYLSLATNGELIFKTTQTGTKSVYFDISYAI